MESTPRGKALARALKLLAIARDQEGQPEGVTAKNMADNLAARWGFTEEELTPSAEAEAERIYRVHVPFSPPCVHAQGALLSVLAEIAEAHSSYRVQEDGAWFGRVYSTDERRAALVLVVFEEVETAIAREIEKSRAVRIQVTNFEAMVKRATGKDEFLKKIESARAIFLKQCRINWYMSIAVALHDIWKARDAPVDGDAAFAEADAKAKAKAEENAVAVVQKPNDFGEQIKKVVAPPPKEPWGFDEEALRFAETLKDSVFGRTA